MKSKIVPAIPQLFTFMTLIAGMASIVLALEGDLAWAGSAILIGVLTDMLDGKIARATKTGSDFGVQLDSLADTVCFGVAASIFMYQYLRLQELSSLVSTLLVLPIPLAGVYRLARFNLLPVKTGEENDTMGLPITSAGGILALTALSGLHYGPKSVPFNFPFSAIMPLFLAVLMASRVRFPTFGSITRRKKTTAVVLGLGTVLSITFTPQLISLTVLLSYVGFGVARAGYGLATR